MAATALFADACRIDPALLPFKSMGPTLTPPIPKYLQASAIGSHSLEISCNKR